MVHFDPSILPCTGDLSGPAAVAEPDVQGVMSLTDSIMVHFDPSVLPCTGDLSGLAAVAQPDDLVLCRYLSTF